MENNKVTLAGFISKEPEYSHTSKLGDSYYISEIEVVRNSGAVDKLPVIFSEDKLYTFVTANASEHFVSITGSYRSRNEEVDGNTKLSLFVFVDNIELVDLGSGNKNEIELSGFLVKAPVYRVTPLGRTVCDIMLAVNRNVRSRSDYIPCIVWGNSAKLIKDSPGGTKIKLVGRIQSRSYTKVIGENREERVAYEVSVNKITKEN